MRHASSPCTRALAGLAALLFAAACGTSGSPDGGSPASTGSLRANLDVADGVELTSAGYSIDGNGYHDEGSFDVSASDAISGLIDGIPEGAGYGLVLTAS